MLEQVDTADTSQPSSQLLEPEQEDIKTIPAGDSVYTSAITFDELNIHPTLLQVTRPARGIW